MRRLITLALALLVLSGGSATLCLAAISDAQARQCCTSNCPDKPAHHPIQCCTLTAAQDAEVAPAAHSADADALAHFSITVAPGAAVPQPASAPIIISAAHSPPLLPTPLRILCSLQL